LDKWPKIKKIDMRFVIWNIRSLYRAGSPIEIAKVISKYMIDLVRIQEVRWDTGGSEPAGEYTFSTERRMRNIN
jgi:hypothetical protein